MMESQILEKAAEAADSMETYVVHVQRMARDDMLGLPLTRAEAISDVADTLESLAKKAERAAKEAREALKENSG